MALDERHRVHANSFGVAADTYERGRPLYPPEAIDWLVPAHATRVADVGAGTGKLTRQLRERGLDVIAVEPSAGMREQLRRAVPGVPVLAGTGEQIPLADHSVDAVLVAQAWHWVDPERAVPEVARVLTPGGRLGLLWNRRVEDEDWVASRSYVITLPDAQRHDVLGRVRDLLDTHPAVAGDDEIALRMVTRCSRADLPG